MRFCAASKFSGLDVILSSRSVYMILVGKPEGNRLEILRRRWEDNIKIDLKEMGLGECGLDSCGSGKGQVAGCCECSEDMRQFIYLNTLCKSTSSSNKFNFCCL
jgi:hypothetical protein